jgi:hypothetical protein
LEAGGKPVKGLFDHACRGKIIWLRDKRGHLVLDTWLFESR